MEQIEVMSWLTLDALKDEDEFYKFIEERKNELGEDKFDTIDYYNENEDNFGGETSGNLEGFSIRSDDSEEDY